MESDLADDNHSEQKSDASGEVQEITLFKVEEELRQFISEITKSLEGGFEDSLSEDTKRSQRSLIAVALAVLLVSTGAIVVSGNVSSNGFTFSVSRPVLLLIGLAASAYLETLVGVRTYAEWKLFRLKNAVAEQQLDQMRQIFQAGLLEPLRISTFIGKDGQIHPEQHYIGGDERQAEFARKAKIWFHSQYVSLIGARRGKFIVEICFPILAGLAAMSSCIWALTHRL